MTRDRALKPSAKYPPVICPKCNGAAESGWTRYGLRHSCCGLVSWGREGLDKAQGPEPRALRSLVYAEFAQLWSVCGIEKAEAYDRLAEYLSLPRDRCMMSEMTVELLNEIPSAFVYILNQIAPTNVKALRLLMQMGEISTADITLIEGYE